MGKYGKRTKVSNGIDNYSVMLTGESGIGKTTIMSKVCEKKFGEDGYILLDCGDEDGTKCINNITAEPVKDYAKFVEVVKDIIQNKETDYPDLKVIIIDTLDELLIATEKKAIDNYNKDNACVKGFKKANTINPLGGGFGKGYDIVFEMVYSKIRALEKVGVKTWIIAHTKSKDVVDAVTSSSYTILTSKMAQRYFDAFKTKMHVCGTACIDRTIEEIETNREDIKHNKINVNKVTGEKRKIVFRDDSYSVDSKSRFSNIIDEIPLDADALIKAIEDAIAYEQGNGTTSTVEKPTPVKETAPVVEETDDDFDDFEVENIDNDVEDSSDDLVFDYVKEETTSVIDVATIREAYRTCKDTNKRAEVKAIIAKFGKLDDVDTDSLSKIYSIITE